LANDDGDEIKDHLFGHRKEENDFKVLTLLFIGNNESLFTAWVCCRLFYNR